ncbi:hypothetical protein N7447_009837 [Penicillium robsamsonii]|uniref:uncharacterized protein n=1 Tax=Penicillium robsamsonii TaxID=1792511 RepID=UPI0025468D87|nr:uncharacterized protein N7447_009837 [Penicillium robsamsonii]KAJ5812814.1 hypothetical protein N7447_009837 [Penicillium robsamsonii]
MAAVLSIRCIAPDELQQIVGQRESQAFGTLCPKPIPYGPGLQGGPTAAARGVNAELVSAEPVILSMPQVRLSPSRGETVDRFALDTPDIV